MPFVQFYGIFYEGYYIFVSIKLQHAYTANQ